MKKELANDVLARLGLSAEESIVYRALLELGQASVSELSRQSGLHRPVVYRALAGLSNRKLVVRSLAGKRQQYAAESPEQLKRLAEEISTALTGELPFLKELYTHRRSRPLITFFQGKKGIIQVYEDVLRTCKRGDIFYRYESPRNYTEYRKYIPQEYYDRFRDRAEVDRLIITNDLVRQQKKERLGRVIKVVPPQYDLFVYNISQFIYGNKVAFLDFNTETATVIESVAFAQFQRQIFKLLFDRL